MSKKTFLKLAAVLLAALAATPLAMAQHRPDPPKSVRLYIFETGSIRGIDPARFRFKKEELAQQDFTVINYLIVHPKGTLMWDSGAIPDSELPADGSPLTRGAFVITKALKPQLAATGYTPADITYFAMSHYHSDHTGNANDFAGATWIVQQAERDWMFAEKPQGIIEPAHYSKLKDSKTIILKGVEDYDVFGDGTVVIKSTPGHTPGHQALFLKLAKTGPVLLAGDLYHYPEERATGRTPTFEFNAEQSTASRGRIEAFIKQNKAQMWIEHDIATHAKLKRAPAYIE